MLPLMVSMTDSTETSSGLNRKAWLFTAIYIENINRGTMYNRNNKLIAMHLSMWVHAVHFWQLWVESCELIICSTWENTSH